MQPHWAKDAIFYHFYPLGCLGAPTRNGFTDAPVTRLEGLHGWLEHLSDLGINALYLSPVFESTAHGYDTADYYHVDRRLGDNDSLRRFSEACHARGIRLILDAVFNHVGRDFWAFKDVQNNPHSPYRDWFYLDPKRRSPHGDPFYYEGWNGHYDLVKLNLRHPDVRTHLFDAVRMWYRDFGIDGLRLDVAECLDLEFQRDLARLCHELKPDSWLLGEVIHGDYRTWANPQTLHSTTNYELYKGFYSSHNDKNYFELAYSLKRQFASGGIYEHLLLYNFVDNHDVDRAVSILKDPAHLYPLYALLFTVPGVPSLYYGSEWGIGGRRDAHSDHALRPCLTPAGRHSSEQPELYDAIRRFIRLRHQHPALRHGDYEEKLVAHEQFAFSRRTHDETLLVAVNAAAEETTITVPMPEGGTYRDLLNSQETFIVQGGKLTLPLYPHWARILIKES